MKRQKVQVWICAQDAKQVLLLRTRPGRGAFWQPVTGSVEADEEPVAAAARESEEETSLDFAGAPEFLHYTFEFLARDGAACEERVYSRSVARIADPKLDPHEHDAFRWVTPEEALDLTQFESNREGLRRLLKQYGRIQS